MVENILHPIHLQDLARKWLREDTSSFDFGGCIADDSPTSAVVLAKSPGIVAGLPFATAVFMELNCTVDWRVRDGDALQPIQIIGTVKGPARNVLLAERIILNCLTRASGVASITRALKQRLVECGWKGMLAATRKTTPLFRMVEKYAVAVGDGCMHRYDLSSMIMLKDNHITICGSIDKAVKKVRSIGGFVHKIDVECQSLKDALEATKAGADVILLDNFKSDDAKQVAAHVKQKYPEVLIEVSGGITEENITDFAEPSIDIISTSSLIQGYKTLDFSMKIRHGNQENLNTM